MKNEILDKTAQIFFRKHSIMNKLYEKPYEPGHSSKLLITLASHKNNRLCNYIRKQHNS